MATKTGGSANKYGAGGKLDGSIRQATREQKKSTGGTTAPPRKIEEAHKEMRRMLTETRKQSASRTRKG